MIVELTEYELQLACTVACQRLAQNRAVGRATRYGEDANSLDLHAIGCIGEIAVAKGYNKFWSGSVGRLRAKDVGSLQVRATILPHGSLLLHPDDEDEDRFFLAIIQGATVDIKGWIYGRDGKLPEFWREDDPARRIRKAYFVPAGALVAV